MLQEIPYSIVLDNAKATAAYSKFDVYLFNSKGRYSDYKKVMFNSWGYTIDDCKWLQSEFEKQGQEKYIKGDYTLNKLDQYGQRINIRVEIPRKNQPGQASFITGWMVNPNGLITLATPYGDD